jgi:signal transduction histidine kinase
VPRGALKNDLPYLFEEFHQAEPPSDAAYDSYGLALSIAQRLAVLLHLEITVQSQLGAGSTFTIDLPATAAR